MGMVKSGLQPVKKRFFHPCFPGIQLRNAALLHAAIRPPFPSSACHGGPSGWYSRVVRRSGDFGFITREQ
jgi:hypothetical protein